uniref:Macaca fascicularis brain cDNA, clone: QflA-16047 n=1 Tax=Macaca fascicularis TaxID=9541 RepID=I7GM83_MACFA|nr:unnamed protein product [Macaca fascicularis]
MKYQKLEREQENDFCFFLISDKFMDCGVCLKRFRFIITYHQYHLNKLLKLSNSQISYLHNKDTRNTFLLGLM